MKYLLDTHTLLWIITEDHKLSENAKSIYLNSDNQIYFSIASLWELAIKLSLNKITLEHSLEEFTEDHITGNDIEIIDIILPHVFRVERLPFHHRDPFDRLIIAQAIEENLSIISSDRVFDLYNVRRVW